MCNIGHTSDYFFSINLNSINKIETICLPQLLFGRPPFLKKKGAARPTEKTSVVRAGLSVTIFSDKNRTLPYVEGPL